MLLSYSPFPIPYYPLPITHYLLMQSDRAHILSLTKNSLNSIKSTFAAALDTSLNSDVLVEYLSAIRNLEDAIDGLQDDKDDEGNGDNDPDPKPYILDDDELIEMGKTRLPQMVVGLGVRRGGFGGLGEK